MLADWQIKRDVIIETPEGHPPHDYGSIEEKIQAQKGKISWGYSSYGFDVRLGYVGQIFSPINATKIDPKHFNPNILVKLDHTESKEPFIIPPHSFMLGQSLEWFEIPRSVGCVVVGKSTYARCGLIVNVTPGEPEWRGFWTIELSNTTDLPLVVYPGEGIMQCIFLRCDGYREALQAFLMRWVKTALPLPPYGVDETVGKTTQQLIELAYRRREMVVDEYYERLLDATCTVSYADKNGKYQNQIGITAPKPN